MSGERLGLDPEEDTRTHYLVNLQFVSLLLMSLNGDSSTDTINI